MYSPELQAEIEVIANGYPSGFTFTVPKGTLWSLVYRGALFVIVHKPESEAFDFLVREDFSNGFRLVTSFTDEPELHCFAKYCEEYLAQKRKGGCDAKN
jgi:hypothetical protein